MHVLMNTWITRSEPSCNLPLALRCRPVPNAVPPRDGHVSPDTQTHTHTMSTSPEPTVALGGDAASYSPSCSAEARALKVMEMANATNRVLTALHSPEPSPESSPQPLRLDSADSAQKHWRHARMAMHMVVGLPLAVGVPVHPDDRDDDAVVAPATPISTPATPPFQSVDWEQGGARAAVASAEQEAPAEPQRGLLFEAATAALVATAYASEGGGGALPPQPEPEPEPAPDPAPEPEPAPEPKPGSMNCKGAHGLVGFTTAEAGYSCDSCGAEDLPTDTVLRGCEICEFDVCETCWEKSQHMSQPEPAPGMKNRSLVTG